MRPIFILLLSLPLLFGCLNANASFKGIVKIGVVAPFSGRDYGTGYRILSAVKLAVKEWNDRAGVEGYRIELIAQDDHNDGEKGALEAEKMVADPDVIGIIGHPNGSSASLAADNYHRGGVAAILLGAATKDYSEVFHLVPGDSKMAGVMADFAAKQLQAKRPAIIYGPGFEGLALAKALSVTDLKGAAVVFEGSLPAQEVDYSGMIDRLKAAAPDLVIFSGAFAPGAAFIAQLRAAGLETPLLGSPALDNPDFIKIAGPASEGVYYASFGPPSGQTGRWGEFAQRYRTASGIEPYGHAALAYDATNLLLEAMERSIKEKGRPDRAAVIKTVGEVERFSGVSGEISFDRSGDNINPSIYIYQVNYPNYPGQLKQTFSGIGKH